MPYQVIYADPPWPFNRGMVMGKATKSGIATGKAREVELSEIYAATMTESELRSYFANDVAALADTSCVMLMWTTDAHIPLALELARLAGFTYKTVGFVWNKKTNTGKQVCYMGTWTTKGTELCLLFTKGTAHKLLKSRKVRQLVEAERRHHSQKPDEVAARIEAMFPDSERIELFAREVRPGWDHIGNESTARQGSHKVGP